MSEHLYFPSLRYSSHWLSIAWQDMQSFILYFNGTWCSYGQPLVYTSDHWISPFHESSSCRTLCITMWIILYSILLDYWNHSTYCSQTFPSCYFQIFAFCTVISDYFMALENLNRLHKYKKQHPSIQLSPLNYMASFPFCYLSVEI